MEFLGDIGKQVVQLCGEVYVDGFQLMTTESFVFPSSTVSLLECCEAAFGQHEVSLSLSSSPCSMPWSLMVVVDAEVLIGDWPEVFTLSSQGGTHPW